MTMDRYPETRYVTTQDGVHIGYQTVGDGPVDLVLNEGWTSNIDANWDMPEIADFQSRLARGKRLIMFDRRGFGVSDRPSSADSMTIEKSADDLRAVLDAVGADRVTIFSMEDGAASSLLFTATYPERTTGLILDAPFVTYWKTRDFPWGLTEADAREWDEMFERAWGTEEFWRWNFESMDDGSGMARLDAWARWSRLCASPHAAYMIDQVERQIDVRALLPQVHVPTLVVMTTNDREIPPWSATPWIAEQIPGARLVEIPAQRHFLTADDAVFFDEVDRFLAELRDQEAEFDRVLASVLFTDIVGSTERAAELGDRRWAELLERHHAVVRAMLARYRGNEVDTAGDGFFATFDGPARAVRAAQAIVDAVRPLGLEVRTGVHTGEVGTIDGSVGGMGVVIGARIGAIAGPSEVLVSSTVKELVAGSGLTFADAGEHELKGVPDRWRLYRVVP